MLVGAQRQAPPGAVVDARKEGIAQLAEDPALSRARPYPKSAASGIAAMLLTLSPSITPLRKKGV